MESNEVTSVVGEQVVVKSTANPPSIGAVVFNERGGKIGIVSDVIGPVEKPFFIVKPNPNVTLKPGDRIRSN